MSYNICLYNKVIFNVLFQVLFRALRDSECKIKCKSRKTRIMCGSDGVSYLSKCEIKRARRCEGKNVTIKKKGKCSGKKKATIYLSSVKANLGPRKKLRGSGYLTYRKFLPLTLIFFSKF